MRLDRVIEAGREKENGSTLEECCRILGCNDLRTARLHLERLEEAAKAAALALAERQVAAVHVELFLLHKLLLVYMNSKYRNLFFDTSFGFGFIPPIQINQYVTEDSDGNPISDKSQRKRKQLNQSHLKLKPV